MNGAGKTGAAEEIVRMWLSDGPDRESKRPRGGADAGGGGATGDWTGRVSPAKAGH